MALVRIADVLPVAGDGKAGVRKAGLQAIPLTELEQTVTKRSH